MPDPFHAKMIDSGMRVVGIDRCSTAEPQLWVGLEGENRMLLSPEKLDELISLLHQWREAKPPTIYTVSTIHFRDSQYGSSPRTVGWFPDLDTATQCVRENWGDIWETTYDYAVIEGVTPGLYTTEGNDEHWFQWKDNAYQPCDKPEQVAGVISFSMG